MCHNVYTEQYLSHYNYNINQIHVIQTSAMILVIVCTRTYAYKAQQFIYHFNTSDQREKPMYKSHIALRALGHRAYISGKALLPVS